MRPPPGYTGEMFRRTPPRAVPARRGVLALVAGLLLILVSSVVAGTRLGWFSTPPAPSVQSPATTALYTIDVPRPAGLPLARVTRVVDGDTIDVRYVDSGLTARVRLLGIDTPEIVAPSRPVECYGREASETTKALLTGKTVGLEADPTQDDVDRYGRQLRYVWLDATLLNYHLVRAGLAHEYTFQAPYRYQRAFRDAQQQAARARLGLWHACPPGQRAGVGQR